MSGLNISFKISAMDDFSQTMSKLNNSLSGASDAIGSLGTAMVGIGVGLGAVVGTAAKFGIDFNAAIEKSTIAWETLTGSVEGAGKMVKNLQDFAKTSPFDYLGIDQVAKKMSAMGWETERILPDLKNIGDAVSAVGGGTEQLNNVGTAFAQMAAKGKVSAEEMNQLAENGIPAWQLLSEATGKPVADLMKMGEQGKLFASEAIPLMMDAMENKFGGSMEKASTTFSGQLERMKETINMTLGAFTAPLFEYLKSVIPVVSSQLETLTTWFTGLPGPIQAIITAVLLLTPLLILIAGGIALIVAVIPAFVAGFTAIAGAVGVTAGVLAGIIGTIAAVVVAVATIGVALVLAYQKVDWFRNGVNTAWSFIKSITISVWDAIVAKLTVAWNAIKSVTESVLNAVRNFIGTQLDKIKSFWDENGEQIKKAVSNAWNFIKDVINSMMPTIKTVISVGLTTIQGVFTTAWNVISGIVTAVWGVIKSVISGAVDVVLGIIKTFASILTGDWEGAWDGVKQITEGAMEALGGIVEGMYDIGVNIIKGLIDGITGMAGDLLDKAREIAKSVTKTIKNAFDINSPSRVMRNLGGYVGEGLALGLTDNLRMITNAASAMTSAATPVLSGVGIGAPSNSGIRGGSLSSGSTLANSSTVNNYYATIDAKNVREINDIIALFNRQSIKQL